MEEKIVRIYKNIFGTVVYISILFLLIAVGYSNIASGVKAETPTDQPSVKTGGGNFPPTPVQVVSPNDRCADAEALVPIIAIGMPGHPLPPPTSFHINAADRKFYNGGNVDDWFKYTTHNLNCQTQLVVELTSDKLQLEVEIYAECFQRPLETSMYWEETSWDDTFENQTVTVHELSGLTKSLTIEDAIKQHAYMIHVNCLAFPEGYPITYTLSITEECHPVPR
jgi:hypothetical protein